MFDELRQALEAADLKEGETIGLKKLSEKTGLRIPKWAEQLKSLSIGFLVREELAKAGFGYAAMRRGRKWTFTFKRI